MFLPLSRSLPFDFGRGGRGVRQNLPRNAPNDYGTRLSLF